MSARTRMAPAAIIIQPDRARRPLVRRSVVGRPVTLAALAPLTRLPPVLQVRAIALAKRVRPRATPPSGSVVPQPAAVLAARRVTCRQDGLPLTARRPRGLRAGRWRDGSRRRPWSQPDARTQERRGARVRGRLPRCHLRRGV